MFPLSPVANFGSYLGLVAMTGRPVCYSNVQWDLQDHLFSKVGNNLNVGLHWPGTSVTIALLTIPLHKLWVFPKYSASCILVAIPPAMCTTIVVAGIIVGNTTFVARLVYSTWLAGSDIIYLSYQPQHLLEHITSPSCCLSKL
jgi:hypothetical protein